MITKSEAVQLVKEFLAENLKKEEWFKNVQDFIKAIILYGSVSKGTNNPNSDIDVLEHNVWNNVSQIVISFLGWALLLKGTLFVVAPSFVDRAGDWVVHSKLITFAATLMIICGICLTWVGYITF